MRQNGLRKLSKKSRVRKWREKVEKKWRENGAKLKCSEFERVE